MSFEVITKLGNDGDHDTVSFETEAEARVYCNEHNIGDNMLAKIKWRTIFDMDKHENVEAHFESKKEAEDFAKENEIPNAKIKKVFMISINGVYHMLVN
jgi:hypothetical protein